MNQAHFLTTVVSLANCPPFKDDRGHLLPEVAIAGRSNVGKSSLLNHLFQQKHLARTSSKPGKTQALNFFSVNRQWIIVDLPGYGYADVPLALRKEWGILVEGYLKERSSLKLILFLFDIRRSPSEADLQLMEWTTYHQVPVILVLTKTDKVNQKEKRKQTEKILKAFEMENLSYLHYSVPKNRGREQLLAMIKARL